MNKKKRKKEKKSAFPTSGLTSFHRSQESVGVVGWHQPATNTTACSLVNPLVCFLLQSEFFCPFFQLESVRSRESICVFRHVCSYIVCLCKYNQASEDIRACPYALLLSAVLLDLHTYTSAACLWHSGHRHIPYMWIVFTRSVSGNLSTYTRTEVISHLRNFWSLVKTDKNWYTVPWIVLLKKALHASQEATP